MHYGPGASLQLWKTVFNQSDCDLWFAEMDFGCVKTHADLLKALNVSVLVGDQGHLRTLHSWVSISKGKFDVIIDDGGHRNHQIMATFNVLWPELNPDGYYFIEDMQVGRNHFYYRYNDTPPVVEIMEAWIDYLVILKKYPIKTSLPIREILVKYPIPLDVDGIYCQFEACVLHKSKEGLQVS